MYDVTFSLGAWSHVPSRGFNPWSHVPFGSHCPGGLCLGSLFEGVSVQGFFVQGSLCRENPLESEKWMVRILLECFLVFIVGSLRVNELIYLTFLRSNVTGKNRGFMVMR